jgi:putative SbcD/Mre11-related phosphoesterase
MRVHDDWLLTSERAAIYLPTATAVIADLHLGYDQARRRGGEAVPAFSLEDTVTALRRLLLHHDVRSLVIAGDLCEDAAGFELVPGLLEELTSAGVELAGVVPGNHDRGLGRNGHGLPLCPDGVQLGGWQVMHGDSKLPRGRVVHGHFHPCLRWRGGLNAACYLHRATRIVLPAFSADAAGVNVIRNAQWRGYRCCAIVGDRVLDFGEVTGLQNRYPKPEIQIM